LLNYDFEVLHWRPKSLLDACLRAGILRVSHAEDPSAVASDMKAQFLQAAANPGLDAPRGTDTYKLAKDYCALLDTILRAAARWELPALADSPVVSLNSTTSWQPLASIDATGELHRFTTVDRWGDNDLSRELHSWHVFGDISATRRPMTIHVIEIGQTRNGRRASPWARGWRHPTMPNLRMRFVHQDGSTFKGWTPMYLADYANSDPAAWVEQMFREGVAQTLVRTVPVAAPSDPVIADTLSQILLEAARASVLITERRSIPWSALPMSRAACDSIIPCAFQPCCHSEKVNINEIGLYLPRKQAYAAVQGGSNGAYSRT